MQQLTTSSGQKSFWARPEGKTGGIVLVGGVCAAGFALWHFLPALIILLTNTVYAVGLMIVLAVLLFLAMSPAVHTTLWALFKITMRAITGIVIPLDPIAIVEGYVEDMEKKQGEMCTQIDKLNGQIKNLEGIISSNDKERQKNLSMAKIAQEKGVTNAMTLNARSANRLETSNIALSTLLTKMKLLYNVLTKMYDASDLVIKDTKDEVRLKKSERKAMMAGYSAFRSAKQILNGDPDKKAMFDQAMEYMAEDLGNKLGEMENFMQMSAGFMQSIELENEADVERGLKQLENWANNAASPLLGTAKTVLIDKSNVVNAVPLSPVTQTVTSNKYKDLI